MFLVVGASGYTGQAVLRALAQRGAPARALIRDPAKSAAVRAAGAAEMAVGDLRDPAALRAALLGCAGVYLIGPRFMADEAEVTKAVIDMAAASGVRRLVYSGVYHPSIRALLNHRAKVTVEDHLFKTDLDFTVLQPARFMHGPVLAGLHRVREAGVYGDAFSPERPMAYVDYADVAEVVAIALTERRLSRGAFELSSPGEHTGHDIAGYFAEALERPVRAERLDLTDYGPALGPELANPFAREGFLRLRDYYDAYGFRGGNSLVLETILGRAPRSLPAFIHRVLERASTPEESHHV